MKQLFDFLPLLVFFLAYKLYGFRIATAALIVAMALALICSWYLRRKLEKMMLIAFAMVAVFGGLTIYFNNIHYLEWKVTVLYLLMAAGLLISQWWLKKPLIQHMLSKELSLPPSLWRRLNIAWVLFFIACGLANVYVVVNLSQNAWVNFKVFGLTGATLIFSLLNGVYIYRHLSDSKTSPDSKNQDT